MRFAGFQHSLAMSEPVASDFRLALVELKHFLDGAVGTGQWDNVESLRSTLDRHHCVGSKLGEHLVSDFVDPCVRGQRRVLTFILVRDKSASEFVG